jgi:hypothetical protein
LINRAGSDVSSEDLTAHFRGLLELIRHTAIFPNPIETLAIGKKLAYNFFMRLAAESLGFQQPLVAARGPPTLEDLAAISLGKCNTVLKREFSDSSHHVIRKGGKHIEKDLNRLLEEAADWESLPFGVPQWMEQPYIPDLVLVGEVRTLVVNGLIAYILHTVPTPGDPHCWTVTALHTVCPRALMRYFFPSLCLTTRAQILGGRLEGNSQNPFKAVDLPHWKQDNDFEKYILSMIGQLILASEYHSKMFSGLRIFCRMDASIYRQEDQIYFFINEFDHSTNTGLFSSADSSEQLESSFVTLSLTLEHAVREGFLSNGGAGLCPLPQ